MNSVLARDLRLGAIRYTGSALGQGASVGGRTAALGILIWAVVAGLTVGRYAHYAREIPAPEAVTADARAKQPGALAIPDIKVVRGTIKAVSNKRIVLQTYGMPPTNYAFGLSDTIIRRGGNASSSSDLVEGETVGVLYVESDGRAIARMILAPRIEASSLMR
jgi:hypothetical protein